MKRFVCLAVLAMAVLAPREGAGQDAPEGTTSLSLRPFGTTTVGLWHRFSPRLELGLEAGGQIGSEEGEDGTGDQRSVFVSIEPVAKLFGAPRGELRPYGAGSLFFNLRGLEFEDELEATSAALGVSLGMGLEWSPVERVRIGGHAGVRAAITDGERTRFEFDNPIPYDVQGWDASTFTTGITVYYTF